MKVYKKCIICLTVAAMLIFSSCSITAKPLQSADGKNSTGNVKLNTTDITSNILKKFDKAMSLDDIWTDVDLGLVLEDNTDGLTAKDKVSEGQIRECYYYDKDNNVVFIDYIGYGEDIFKYFTKSKSGLELTVSYDDIGNGMRDIDIASEKYWVRHSYYSVAKDADNFQYEITVHINKPIDDSENNFDEYIIYSIKDNVGYISKAFYCDDDGYHKYRYWHDENDGKYDTETDKVRYKKVDSVNIDNGLPTLVNDKRVISSEFVSGDKLKYTLNNDGSKQWYFVSCIYNVFDDQATAEEYAKDYGLKAEKFFIGEYKETYRWVVAIQNAILPADIPFKDIYKIATSTDESSYFVKITLSSDGRLTGASEKGAVL